MDIVASSPSSPRLSSLVEVSAAYRTADSNTHAMQTRGDVHATAAAGSTATHIVPASAVTDAGSACGKDLRVFGQTRSSSRRRADASVPSESPVRVSCLFLFSLGVCRM